MEDTLMRIAERKKDWALTESAFSQLLSWLDEGEDSGGEKYLEMRRRLVSYFDRKNCQAPDELADEALNRVARRLEEKGSITDASPAHYCYIVARFVFLESLRRVDMNEVSLDNLSASSQAIVNPEAVSQQKDESELNEERLDCLGRCLQALDHGSREIIVAYYRGEQQAKIENRRALAKALGITMNALSVRACRMRNRLEDCVKKCLSQ